MSVAAVKERSPSLEDARRAARELVAAGVGTVLLFGSVARGEATEDSDIDLVAICDDLGDYRQRHEVQAELQRRVRGVASWPVHVFVTDAPEWAVRTQRVPCSFEAGIAANAIRLADNGSHGLIDWGKEIGMPDSPHAEVESRFRDVSGALFSLAHNLVPSAQEAQVAAIGDFLEHVSQEMERFTMACAAAHQTFEATAKLMMAITAGKPAPYSHNIDELLASQPRWVVETFESAARDVDLTRLSDWHQAKNYRSLRPIDDFDEIYLQRHAEAAVQIARFAGQQARQHGVSAKLIHSLDVRLKNCEHAVKQPHRIPIDLPDRGLQWDDLFGQES